MPQPTFFLPILPFFFIVSFSLKANIIHGTTLSTYCPTNTCGDNEIKYPFWKVQSSSSSQEYCGYPGFGIECSSSNESMIHLADDYFHVQNIDYVNSRIRLVDIDAIANKSCPRAGHNLTFDQDKIPLYLNSLLDFNLTFYFNCIAAVPLPSASPIDCLRSEKSMSYVIFTGNETVDLPWYSFCEKKVVATVVLEGEDAWVTNGFVRALNQGFVLDWKNTMHCAECEKSGGRCAFNSETDEFSCLCFDGCKKATQLVYIENLSEVLDKYFGKKIEILEEHRRDGEL